ncbi:hypothetical protein AVEN_63270-1 [Araneus ventricosus]|uniref:Uncharacterized protein n=1 Tax=Araneus ventricosus TaxID=182803 RepID=A0A4Y2K386_ARAVE|nr:hypothetical protein AVEN_63270-1 [Araneus ventricosus]
MKTSQPSTFCQILAALRRVWAPPAAKQGEDPDPDSGLTGRRQRVKVPGRDECQEGSKTKRRRGKLETRQVRRRKKKCNLCAWKPLVVVTKSDCTSDWAQRRLCFRVGFGLNGYCQIEEDRAQVDKCYVQGRFLE